MTWVRQSRCYLSLGGERKEERKKSENRNKCNTTSVLLNSLRIQYDKNNRVHRVCKRINNNILFETY